MKQVEFKAISKTIQGVETILQGFAFEHVKGKIRFTPDQIHPYSVEKQYPKNLVNCCIGWVGETPLIRSGHINTLSKAHEWVVLARSIIPTKQTNLRLSSAQMSSVEFEGEFIDQQHLALIQATQKLWESEKLVHLSTPLEYVYSTQSFERKVWADQTALDEIPKLHNTEAWADYCAWYNELLEEAFSHFLYDAIDEYTLEAHLKDFRHEVFSDFLERTRSQLLKLELERATNQLEGLSHSELVARDKEMLLSRHDMQRMVGEHYKSLVEIVRIVKIVQEAHPDLIDLNVVGRLLKALLGYEVDAPNIPRPNWGIKQMILQLLNDELGVVSSVNCHHGLDKTHLAFAIRMAVLQMKELHSREEIIELALDWENSSHVDQFRECVLDNLLEFCVPLTHLNTGGKTMRWDESMHIHADLLPFIPKERTMLNAIEEFERMTLVDSEGLTVVGHHLMSNFLSNGTV